MTKRRPLIAGNWKMNGVSDAGLSLAKQISQKSEDLTHVDLVIAPPATLLQSVFNQIDGSQVKLGAQNMHYQPKGAFTGELSAEMIQSVGCEFVILGHSERRQYFGETDEMVNRKVATALEKGLKPIVCVGESLDERKSGWMERKIALQVYSAFHAVSKEDAPKITIAYEPIWAIGTGETASPEQAQEVHRQIRALLTERFDEETAQKIRLLYGGSVNRNNVNDLIVEKDIDGALVGGASLDADHFITLAQAAQNYSADKT